MPTYPYIHPVTGEKREIVASMRNAPPDEVLIYPGGAWLAAENPDGSRNEFDPADEAKYLFKRDRIAQQPIVSVRQGDGLRHSLRGVKSIASKSMPLETEAGEIRSLSGTKVRYNAKHGTYSTLKGERIIRNKSDRQRHLGALAMEDCRE